MIFCKTIISHNYASDFTGACSHFSSQVARLHGGAHLEAQRYKLQIPEVSRNSGGCGGGRGRGHWMHDVCDGAGRGGRDRREGRSGRRNQTTINGVDVLDPTRNFTADEWTSLGWNSGWAYIDQAREHMNRIERGGRGGGRDGGRGYVRGGGPLNVNELNSSNSGKHDEGRHGGQGEGKGHRELNGGDKIGRNGTVFSHGAYH